MVTSAWRALRRRILTPSMTETKLSTRGFYVKSPDARELLETIGEMFLTGYAYAAEARDPLDAEARLEELPRQFRGFAYEGAGMGFAVRDGLPSGGTRHVARFLEGEASKHIYMVYVGVGWAMARVPGFRRSKLHAPDPLLRWLALDGYGFHQAYFETDKYVHEQHQEQDLRWPADGPRWYTERVIDQGIGRAMWFVCGTDAELVADLIDKFPEIRRADLYSGAGLAATYAGGAEEDELRLFRFRAGQHAPMVAQAAAFAATARVEAGLVVPHTKLATRILCGTTPEAASALCARVRPEDPAGGEMPGYEVWRQRIAAELNERQGVQP